MIKQGGYKDTRCEEMIDTIIQALTATDYKVVRMSDTDCYTTTSYDCIIIKDWKWPGNIFTVNIDNKNNEHYASLFKEQSTNTLTEEEFIETYRQRCEGISTEWFQGCSYRHRLNGYERE